MQPMTLNSHDLKVIAFHVAVAMALAGIAELTKVNFGVYTPFVLLGLQTLAEAIRRYVH